MAVTTPKRSQNSACTAYATYILMVANVAVYMMTLTPGRDALIGALGLVPGRVSMGNLLTYGLTHTSPAHLVGNMLFLWLFGRRVERALGHIGFVLAYELCGVASALVHLTVVGAAYPESAHAPLVGASGAIAGVLGIYAVRFHSQTIVRVGRRAVPSMLAIGLWFATQIVGAVISSLRSEPGGVAYWSHLGGVAFGMLLAQALRLGTVGQRECVRAEVVGSLDRGEQLEAMRCLRAALCDDPADADAYGRLGELHAVLQNRDQAIECYKQSIELHLKRGEDDRAVARYAELQHYFSGAHVGVKTEYRIAMRLADCGCAEAAVEVYESIAAGYAETPEAEVALTRAAELRMTQLADRDGALACYERFLRAYPNSSLRAMVERSLSGMRSSDTAH